MYQIQDSIIINRSVEDVFDFVAYSEQDRHWQKTLVESEKLNDSSIQVGTQYRHVYRFLGNNFNLTATITELVPSQKYILKHEGTTNSLDSYTFESLGEQTKITYTYQSEEEMSHLFGTISLFFVKQTYKRVIKSTLENLKTLLEAN